MADEPPHSSGALWSAGFSGVLWCDDRVLLARGRRPLHAALRRDEDTCGWRTTLGGHREAPAPRWWRPVAAT